METSNHGPGSHNQIDLAKEWVKDNEARVKRFDDTMPSRPVAKAQHKATSPNTESPPAVSTCTCHEWMPQFIERKLSDLLMAKLESGLQGIGRCVIQDQAKLQKDLIGWAQYDHNEVKGYIGQTLTWIEQNQGNLLSRLEMFEKTLSELLTQRNVGIHPKQLDETQSTMESEHHRHTIEVLNTLVREVEIIKSVLISKSTDSETSQQSDHELRAHQGGTAEKPHGVLNRIKSYVTPSSTQSQEVLVLKEEKESLRREIERINSCYAKEVQELQRELEATKDKNRRLTSAVMTHKRQTEGEWRCSETPSSVASNFEKLFSTTRCSSGDAFLKSPSGRELANDIFKAAYEECHTAVLKELFKELFCHHKEGDDTTTAEDQKRIYGKLLFLKQKPLQAILDDQLAMLTSQVLRRAQERFDNYEDVKADTKYSFAQAAVKTALDMIAMQPPMIIDYPPKFLGDNVQTKQSEDWDEGLEKSQREYTLRYFRPVLYSNYGEQEVSKLGYVGNKPSSG